MTTFAGKPLSIVRQRRIARLKCVIFLTEHPDVARWFRIVPRLKTSPRKSPRK